jgi:hypothetical protein
VNEGLKQTISRAEEMIAIVPTSITTIVKSDLQRLIDAARRLDAVERERDGFEAWANTLESCGWHDAEECECPYCTANDVRKSTDVLEPDVAKAVCYCGTCRRTWLETPTGHDIVAHVFDKVLAQAIIDAYNKAQQKELSSEEVNVLRNKATQELNLYRREQTARISA